MSAITVTGSIDLAAIYANGYPATGDATHFTNNPSPRTLNPTTISANGTGFTYGGAFPFLDGGTLTELHVARYHSLPQSGPIQNVLDGSLDITGVIANAAGVLTSGLPLAQALLLGDDIFNLGASSGRFFGDFAATPDVAVRGGNDQLTSDILSTASIIAYGDAISSLGTAMFSLRGGHDALHIGAGFAHLSGDVGDTNRTLFGGSDTIHRWGVNAVGAGGAASFATGDAVTVSAGTTFSGADSITGADGGTAGEVLVGDVINMLHGILHGGADTIMGLGGDDLLFGDARTIGDGTAIGPVIFGGNDKLYGGSGNDHLVGGGGNDLLDGGAGTDTAGYNQQAFDANGNAAESGIAVVLVDGTASGYAHGAHGTDSLISIENVIGSFGNDILIGNSGANTLNGSAGNDSVSGKAGNDVLLGEAGNDQLSGGDGNDYLNGGAGDNRLFGEAGNDTLIESGAVAATFTVLDGGAGNDRLIGAATGTRTMNGGTGNDVIAIGGGDNWATTGTGIDTLQFRNFAAITSDAFAEVYDFTVNTDRIDLRALGITTATVDAKVEIGDWDTGAYVQVTNGGHTQTLLLDGVHAWELDKHSYDFILG